MDALKEPRCDVVRELTRDTWSHWPIRGVPALDSFSEAPQYMQNITVSKVSIYRPLYTTHDHVVANRLSNVCHIMNVELSGCSKTVAVSVYVVL